jgi:hypothetical protein
MFTLIVLGLIAWFAYRHFTKKKREADLRNWRVEYRNSDIKPVTRRLPWKDIA